MTSVELFQLISKPWATVRDIKKIASCGRDNATLIRNEIEKEISKKGKKLPVCKEKVVPMTYVIDYLGLNISHIAFMAQQEKIIEVEA